MQFVRTKVQPQIKQMLTKLIKNQQIDIDKTALAKLERHLAKVVTEYIDGYEEIDTKAYKVLAEHDVHPQDFYKRVIKSVAEKEDFPLESDALDMLNQQIEEILWNDDAVEEIYADSRELVATITPYLKAMQRM